MQDSYSKIFSDKQKIMFVMAHPDDTEIFAGGTVARLLEDNKEVLLVKMTPGNKGSRQQQVSESDLTNIRLSEDQQASSVLGAKPHDTICLDLKDGEIENDLPTIGKLVEQIRIFRPELIVTHNPEQSIITFSKGESWLNHRDHRHTGQLALDASYPYSRDLLFFPHHFQNTLAKSHVVSQFLLVDYYNHPDEVGIDISDFIQTKISAVTAHKSQFSPEKAKSLVEYLNTNPDGKFFERFRYVIAD